MCHPYPHLQVWRHSQWSNLSCCPWSGQSALQYRWETKWFYRGMTDRSRLSSLCRASLSTSAQSGQQQPVDGKNRIFSANSPSVANHLPPSSVPQPPHGCKSPLALRKHQPWRPQNCSSRNNAIPPPHQEYSR